MHASLKVETVFLCVSSSYVIYIIILDKASMDKVTVTAAVL